MCMAKERGKIVYEGIQKVINGKVIFMRQCMRYKAFVKELVKRIQEENLLDTLQYSELCMRGKGFSTLTLCEKDLEELFDRMFLGKLNQHIRKTDDPFYEIYALPMSRNEEEIKLDATYPIVYGIVTNERCRAALAKIEERNEYYTYYEQSEYKNLYFEGFFRAEQIWDVRFLIGLLGKMRQEREDESIYRLLMKIIYAGYGYIKRQIKARDVISGTVVKEILCKEIPEENCMLPMVGRIMLLMVMAEDMGIPYEWDYDTLVMLHFYESAVDIFTNGERAHAGLENYEVDQKEFFRKYDEKYLTHSSMLGLLSGKEVEQMEELMLRIFDMYQMSPRKFWGYDLTEKETKCLMDQSGRWSQRTYATGLMLAQLCKYIRQLESQYMMCSKDYAGMQIQLAWQEKEEAHQRQQQKDNELKQLAAEKRGQKETILKQEQELRKLQKQVTDQEQQIAEQLQELGEMRSYIYSLSENWEEENTEKRESPKVSGWKEKRVLVVGGHRNWQNKLRELFPKWQFISAGQNNLDDDMIRGKDCIICNTEVLAHSCYYKVLSGRERRQKLYYVHSNNIQKCLKELEQQMEA